MVINGPVAKAGSIFSLSRVMGTSVPFAYPASADVMNM